MQVFFFFQIPSRDLTDLFSKFFFVVVFSDDDDDDGGGDDDDDVYD